MRHSKIIDFIVGLFIIAGFAALVFLATKVGNLDTSNESGYKVYASFTNIGDLKTKAPVTMAGVRIGRVGDIKINKELYEAEVELIIDGQYDNLPLDSSVSILTAGLLGSKYVGLEPGAEDEYLKDNSKIEFVQSAVVLENLIGQFLSSGGGSKN